MKKFYAFYPGKRFPSISLTGTRCSLDCAHCGGVYLKGMMPAETPKDLEKALLDLWDRGGIGALVSGGCGGLGAVPFGAFLGTLKKIKNDTGLIINLHTGIVDSAQCRLIDETGIDAVSFDTVGSQRIIKEVYGLPLTVNDYIKSLECLFSMERVKTVPHLCVGMEGNDRGGEEAALDFISSFSPERLVITSFIPTKGTRMGIFPAPSGEHIASIIRMAGDLNPDSQIILGCMRKRGGDAEKLALHEGVDGIVLPSKRTVDLAASMDREVIRVETCCAFGV